MRVVFVGTEPLLGHVTAMWKLPTKKKTSAANYVDLMLLLGTTSVSSLSAAKPSLLFAVRSYEVQRETIKPALTRES